jgi:transcriptional regulator of acetoin/glycerol metabolism
MDLLRRHTWPGNVRELRNVLERALMNSDEDRLEPADFPNLLKHADGREPARPAPAPGTSYAETMADAERRILQAALAAARGRVADAARRLGIGRATIYKRMRALGLPSLNRDKSLNGDKTPRSLPR